MPFSFARTAISSAAARNVRLAHRPPILRTLHSSTRRPAQTYLCPSCSQPLPTPLPACSKCWNIQTTPVTQSTYDLHELLDIPSEPNPFAVDEKLLKVNFRKAQAACHPDTWASKGDDKQFIAQTLSSRVNAAYQTLTNPLHRIAYILEKKDLPLAEEDQIDDPQFLMEMFTAREELEEADNLQALESLDESSSVELQELLFDIKNKVGDGDWPSVKRSALRLKYVDGLRRELKQKLGGFQ